MQSSANTCLVRHLLRDAQLTEKVRKVALTTTMTRRTRKRKKRSLRSLKSPKSPLQMLRKINRLRSYKRVSLKEKVALKRKRAMRTANMKRKKMAMEKKITMRKAAISGVRRAPTGTGTTRRTKKHSNVVIPCQTLSILQSTLIAKLSKKLLLKPLRKTSTATLSTRLRNANNARLAEILTLAADVLDICELYFRTYPS